MTDTTPEPCCSTPRPDCMGMLIPGIGNRCAAMQATPITPQDLIDLGYSRHWVESCLRISRAMQIKGLQQQRLKSRPS